jgi:DNA-binding MarR family transcriptional regulator
MAATRLSQLQTRILRWVAVDAQRTRGGVASSHQELVRALKSDKGNISHSLRTLEARGWLVIDRSAGGKAESLRLTPEGQKWAGQVA